MILPAISIRQPWAWAILYAGKDIENRSWILAKLFMHNPNLLHTGKTVDEEGFRRLRKWGIDVPDDLPLGGIVGRIQFGDPRHVKPFEELSRWADRGQAHWPIESSAPLPFFPCAGKLGFFNVNYPYPLEA
jgi:hypothetical protein